MAFWTMWLKRVIIRFRWYRHGSQRMENLRFAMNRMPQPEQSFGMGLKVTALPVSG